MGRSAPRTRGMAKCRSVRVLGVGDQASNSYMAPCGGLGTRVYLTQLWSLAPYPRGGWRDLGPRCRQTEYHKVEFNLPNIHVGLWSPWLGTSEASVGQGSGPRPGSEENAEGQPTGGHGLPGCIPEPLPGGGGPQPISGNHFPSQPLPRAPILITARTSDVT